VCVVERSPLSHATLHSVSSRGSAVKDLTTPGHGTDVGGATHARVQVISLSLCAGAALAFIAATNLAWFGALGSDNPEPQYSALSVRSLAPGPQAGLVPGTQSWGYLLVAWSALLAALAVVAAAVICLRDRRQRGRRLNRLLLCVGCASLVLVAMVIPELRVNVYYDWVSSVGFDWGALVGLGLAVLGSIGAWFAWATWTHPALWATHSALD
jgi:hypothetical protein